MPAPVSLISRWFIKPDHADAVREALVRLAAEVQAHEPDTLAYLVNLPLRDEPRLQSLPPARAFDVVFFETYRNADAFLAHLNGPVFKRFVTAHGTQFEGSDGKPFTTVEFLDRHAGFIRAGLGAGAVAAAGSAEPNRHPGVMFEIMAKDQPAMQRFYTKLFGWRYRTGSGGFAYIHFPAGVPPLLGGIGQAEAGTPGLAPGHNFYLLVNDLAAMMAAAIAAGGQSLMPPTSIDGYNFAMFTDPEGNPIGLVEPFSQ